MNEQLSIALNGNIMPCPYREECRTYKIGCSGESYWCNNAEGMRKEVEKKCKNCDHFHGVWKQKGCYACYRKSPSPSSDPERTCEYWIPREGEMEEEI